MAEAAREGLSIDAWLSRILDPIIAKLPAADDPSPYYGTNEPDD